MTDPEVVEVDSDDNEILSAEKMVSLYTCATRNLKERRKEEEAISGTGTKMNEPSGSPEESRLLQSRLKALDSSISAPRVTPRNQLSEGVWDGTVVKIVKAIGKVWEVVGFVDPELGNLCCHPEEALFLMESNNLEITHNGIPLSIQTAFQSLTNVCSLEHYLVYSHLSRLGYKVVRHKGGSRLPKVLRSVDNDDLITESKDTSSRFKNKSKKSAFKIVQDILETVIVNAVREPEDREDLEVDQTEANRLKYLSMIPNCFGKSELTLVKPALDLLPPGSQPQKSSYTWKFRQHEVEDDIQIVGEIPAKKPRVEPPDIEFVAAITSPKAKPFTGQSRRFYGQFLGGNQPVLPDKNPNSKWEGLERKDTVKTGFLNKLWSGSVVPLVKPSDATSTANILAKLQSKSPDKPEKSGLKSEFEISYDVFLPKSQFKKSEKCLPDYRVVVCGSDSGRFPNCKDIFKVTAECGDRVPVLFAVSALGSVSFYCLSAVDLPTLISLG